MELNPAIQLVIFTGIFTVLSGAVILYIRRWYQYWRQVFLISAMEKQRSGGKKSIYEDKQGVVLSGPAYLFTGLAFCCALVLLTYKTILNIAAILFSLVYSMALRVLATGP